MLTNHFDIARSRSRRNQKNKDDISERISLQRADNSDSSSTISATLNSPDPTRKILSFDHDDPDNPYNWHWVYLRLRIIKFDVLKLIIHHIGQKTPRPLRFHPRCHEFNHRLRPRVKLRPLLRCRIRHNLKLPPGPCNLHVPNGLCGWPCLLRSNERTIWTTYSHDLGIRLVYHLYYGLRSGAKLCCFGCV